MLVGCDRCTQGFKILGKPEDFNVLHETKWATGYPCPTPGCGSVLRCEFSNVGRFHQISVTAFYRAIHGMGFGKSAEAGPEKVLELLKTKRVIGGDLQPIGEPKRSILKSLTFDDGTVMYLASSNEGACVYLIEEGNEFYENRSVAPDGNPEDSPEAGAQIGHLAAREESPRGRISDDAADAEPKSGPDYGTAGEVHTGAASGPRPGGHGS